MQYKGQHDTLELICLFIEYDVMTADKPQLIAQHMSKRQL